MRTIRVALPKGRLGEKTYAVLADAGFPCPQMEEENRRLIFDNPACGVRYFLVKPSDVTVYVERGAADVGIVGKDILLEAEPDVFELCDLRMGRCRVCVAGPEDFQDDHARALRVATKFPRIAREYYSRRGREIELIRLNGSIELAPLVGLSDVIVDIVETGTTLRENGLAVLETIEPISARFIANKASFRFMGAEIAAMQRALGRAAEEHA